MRDSISLMKHSRSTENIYDIIANEHLRITSDRFLQEMVSVDPHIVFSFKINHDFQQEINNIIIDHIHFSFEFIKKSNFLEINYKIESPALIDNSFKIFSFNFLLKFNQNEKTSKDTIRVVISNYEIYYSNIVKLNDFKFLLNKMINHVDVQLKIFIKITYFDSLFQNFLIYNLKEYCADVRLKSLSKKNVIALLKNRHLVIDHQNQLATFIGIWLLDEKNIEDDFLEIVNTVQWTQVTIDVLFEFIIRFKCLIDKFKLEEFFSESIKKSLHDFQLESNYFVN